MHLVANMVAIPTEKIEEVLCRRAVPGFTGSVIAWVIVLPTAAHEVEFRFETDTALQIQRQDDPESPHVTNARVASVRRALAENERLFRLGTKLKGLKFNFRNGELMKCNAIEVE
jgi:hypothetical protein